MISCKRIKGAHWQETGGGVSLKTPVLWSLTTRKIPNKSNTLRLVLGLFPDNNIVSYWKGQCTLKVQENLNEIKNNFREASWISTFQFSPKMILHLHDKPTTNKPILRGEYGFKNTMMQSAVLVFSPGCCALSPRRYREAAENRIYQTITFLISRKWTQNKAFEVAVSLLSSKSNW